MAQMDSQTLRTLILARRDASSNRLDSEYSKNRREALAFYRGDSHPAYGQDEPGMSKVISRDTLESVESMIPQLLKPFVSGDEVVRFEPTGPEDEEPAKQASEYINYLFTRRNDGYSIIHTSLKDGLLFRLGVGKVVREETENYKTENYTALSDIEVQALSMDEDIEITSAKPSQDLPGTFDVQVQRKETKGQIAIYCIPPDEFLFERHLVRLEDATFLGQESRRSVADLIAMGLDPVKCKALTTDTDTAYNTERTQRFLGENPVPVTTDTDIARMVRVSECYVKCDYEGNGKLVWRRVFLAGGDDSILSDEPVDCHPYVAWTPIPIPHKLVGMSIHDMVRDIQLVKTALSREVQNNIYLSNRPMREVVDGQVNIDDVLNPRVGGIVRVKQQGAMREVATTFTAGASQAIIEYYDTLREQRTGSTRYNQGMDADSLNKTATGISNIMAAAGQRMEMFARQYAEQFLKPLFLKMLELVCKNPDEREVIRLRNQWVEMDPREWSTQYDMTVTVGLGTGSREKMVAELQQLLAIDQQIIQLQGGASGPLVTMENIFNKLEKLGEAMGLKGFDRYYTDPAQTPPPPPQPSQADHEAMKLQTEGDIKIQIAQIQSATAIEVAKIKGEVDLLKLQLAVPPAINAQTFGEGMGPDGSPPHEMAEAPQYEAQEPQFEAQGPMTEGSDEGDPYGLQTPAPFAG